MIKIIPLTIACMLQAAARQHIPPPIMWGLYSVEAGQVGTSSPNSNGSHDLGPLQINGRTWVKPIADLLFNGNIRKSREELQWNGCFNAQVSAWIFHIYLKQDNQNLAEAVGNYNSHDPVAMKRYQKIFRHKLLELYGFGSRNISPPPFETKNAKPAINMFIEGKINPPTSGLDTITGRTNSR